MKNTTTTKREAWAKRVKLIPKHITGEQREILIETVKNLNAMKWFDINFALGIDVDPELEMLATHLGVFKGKLFWFNPTSPIMDMGDEAGDRAQNNRPTVILHGKKYNTSKVAWELLKRSKIEGELTYNTERPSCIKDAKEYIKREDGFIEIITYNSLMADEYFRLAKYDEHVKNRPYDSMTNYVKSIRSILTEFMDENGIIYSKKAEETFEHGFEGRVKYHSDVLRTELNFSIKNKEFSGDNYEWQIRKAFNKAIRKIFIGANRVDDQDFTLPKNWESLMSKFMMAARDLIELDLKTNG